MAKDSRGVDIKPGDTVRMIRDHTYHVTFPQRPGQQFERGLYTGQSLEVTNPNGSMIWVRTFEGNVAIPAGKVEKVVA